MISQEKSSFFALPLFPALAAVLLAGCATWPPPTDAPPDAVMTVEITSDPSGAEIRSVAKTHDGDIDWPNSIKVGTTPFKGLTAFYVHPEGYRIAVQSPDNSARLFHYKANNRWWLLGSKSKAVLFLEFDLKKKGYKKTRVKEVVFDSEVTRIIGFTDAPDATDKMKKALAEKKLVKHNYVLTK